MRTGSSINIFSRDICYQCYQLSTSNAFICGFTQNFEQVYACYKMFNSIILIQFRLKFHWIPPENVRKPMVFWRFQGVQKWNIGLKWVNRQVKIQKKNSWLVYSASNWTCMKLLQQNNNNTYLNPIIYLI